MVSFKRTSDYFGFKLVDDRAKQTSDCERRLLNFPRLSIRRQPMVENRASDSHLADWLTRQIQNGEFGDAFSFPRGMSRCSAPEADA
jgi:hypothetical protein